MYRLRDLDPPADQTPEGVRCSAPNCLNNTRLGKPYCPQHIEYLPYIQMVLAEIRRRDREGNWLDQGQQITISSHYVHEAMVVLKTGPHSILRLGRALDITNAAAATLSHVLQQTGLVTLKKTTRGSLALVLTGFEEELEEPDDEDEPPEHILGGLRAS